jgi:hypothetical protein
MGLIDLFDDRAMQYLETSGSNELKHFAKSKDFWGMGRKVVAEQLHLDVQAMHFYEWKPKGIKGYL